jgi:hypothetical protein
MYKKRTLICALNSLPLLHGGAIANILQELQ